MTCTDLAPICPWYDDILPVHVWQERINQIETQLSPLLQRHLQQRSQHRKDPVLDFLFEYYSFRPALLLRWSPGIGVVLQGEEADAFLQQTGFVRTDLGVLLDASLFPQRRLNTTRWMRNLLHATQQRQPVWGCFGMHEWAMVYRTEEPRHRQIPLRPTAHEIESFVESRPLLCTHFDAFRFFTPAAKPMNRLQLSREMQEYHEQPGCLHANMDLYKWAYKIYPWLPSELLVETFLLAYEARTLDMRASPYEMTQQGLEPLCVETPEGRLQYQEQQAAIYARALPIRQKLLLAYDRLLQVALATTSEKV